MNLNRIQGILLENSFVGLKNVQNVTMELNNKDLSEVNFSEYIVNIFCIIERFVNLISEKQEKEKN